MARSQASTRLAAEPHDTPPAALLIGPIAAVIMYIAGLFWFLLGGLSVIPQDGKEQLGLGAALALICLELFVAIAVWTALKLTKFRWAFPLATCVVVFNYGLMLVGGIPLFSEDGPTPWPLLFIWAVTSPIIILGLHNVFDKLKKKRRRFVRYVAPVLLVTSFLLILGFRPLPI